MSTSDPAVVVGTDLSSTSEPALHWAATEAARLALPLRIVHAYPPPTYPSTGAGLLPGGEVVGLGEELRKVAVRETSSAADRVTVDHPGLLVQTVTRCGTPGSTLVEASRDARLVVVGARGLGAVKGILFGSVSVHVCAHSLTPVVVVRGASRPPADARVVVGVDGSETSREALAFAVAQASSRGVGLTAVHMWQVEGAGGAAAAGSPADWGQPAEEEAAVVAEAMAGLCEQYPDVDVRRHVAAGDPAEELARLSENACLLVVGTRGRGTVQGWLRGSVSQAVLHAAHCPVVVVHPTSTEEDRARGRRDHGTEPGPVPAPFRVLA